RSTKIYYGDPDSRMISNDDLISNKEKFFRSNNDLDLIGEAEESHSFVSFEAKVFDSVNFFASLDVPAFLITSNSKLANLIIKVVEESMQELPGKERLINIYTENIVVEIIRYILKNKMFVEQLATNSTYFKDPRLIDLFNYIKENIGGDLSNKVLSNVANVSEDYVGQYFKMLTGINPQDYIEYQRMERAVFLLRTTKKSIREIGKEVGYKDTAYFCRRFKMMFGIPAGKMRRRESAMNI
ncbi:MAG: AraC family transcriptional regulator, partial [Bacteroidota bacterium]|nr:AraC family transcriptional regulator [Bacteroidota bacterium]